MEDSKKYTAIHYHEYLELDKLLNAQHPRSEKFEEKPAHDEMLFIIMHQVYELWFKQIIHELEAVADIFRSDVIKEGDLSVVVLRLKRITEIMELIIKQIYVMETLTPLDFLDFRSYLFPASGFQSIQFRVVEALLGLREEDRMTYNGHSYKIVFNEDQKKRLDKIESSGSVFELIEKWLERSPFLKTDSFDFLKLYKEALDRMLKKETAAIEATDYLAEPMKKMRLRVLGDTDSYFKRVLSEEEHNKVIKEGKLRLSYKATLSALLINLYREKPVFSLPYNVLMELMNIDELMTTWRYRHAQMVMRMIGNKIGTGGSSGHEYLTKTAEKHKIFKDLHNISSLLIPRSELPDLPADLVQKLGFFYNGK